MLKLLHQNKNLTCKNFGIFLKNKRYKQGRLKRFVLKFGFGKLSQGYLDLKSIGNYK